MQEKEANQKMFGDLVSISKLLHIDHRVLINQFCDINHWHMETEIRFIIKAKGTISILDEEYQFKPGQLYIIPPFISHKIVLDHPNSPYERYNAYVDIPLCDMFLLPEDAKQFSELFLKFAFLQKYQFDVSAFQNQLLDFLDTLFHYQGCMKKTYQENKLIEFLIILYEILKKEENNYPLDEQKFIFMKDVLNYVSENLSEITVKMLAEHFQIRESELNKWFHNYAGCSTNQYIIHQKARKASQLLRLGKSIKEVYQSVGYRDYSSLERAMKKSMKENLSYYKTYHPPYIDELQ